jgi:hypothetical protein
MRLHDGKLQEQAAPRSDEWRDVDPALGLLASRVLGMEKVKYDNDGFYLMPPDVYAKFKGRLIQNHKGQVASFPSKSKLERTNPRGAAIDLATDWDDFIWDRDDRCWRWPTTLERAKKTKKLADGSLLFDHTLPPDPPGFTPQSLGEVAKEVKARRR